MYHVIFMEIGIDSFAEAQLDNGKSYSENSAQSISDLLDRIEHADKVGLDVFGIGEHYRKEFLDSANSVILSAAASRTKNIRLTSAVTVLSAADPVRAFQNFATLDLVSSGRAEPTAIIKPATFQLTSASYEVQDTDSGPTLEISVSVANIGGQDGRPNVLEIKLVDKKDTSLMSWPMVLSGAPIPAGNQTVYRTRLVEPPKGFANVQVSMPSP